LAEFFVAQVQKLERDGGERGRGGLLITSVNGVAVAEHPLAKYLLDAGFQAAPLGFNVRRGLPALPGKSGSTDRVEGNVEAKHV
jgi:ATP-dependent Lhr-like helicase